MHVEKIWKLISAMANEAPWWTSWLVYDGILIVGGKCCLLSRWEAIFMWWSVPILKNSTAQFVFVECPGAPRNGNNSLLGFDSGFSFTITLWIMGWEVCCIKPHCLEKSWKCLACRRQHYQSHYLSQVNRQLSKTFVWYIRVSNTGQPIFLLQGGGNEETTFKNIKSSSMLTCSPACQHHLHNSLSWLRWSGKPCRISCLGCCYSWSWSA